MRLRVILFTLMIMGTASVVLGGVDTSKTELDTMAYFYNIPDAPDMYSAANVSARMVEGLGFRYYWATKDLRPEDLSYDPGNGAQTCEQVLDHLLGLSRFILRTIKKEVHDNTREYPELTWVGKREETLENFKEASEILRQTVDVSELEIIFKRGEKTSGFPYWNLINGPISDAIYHTGQITSYRRSAGNPINPNISLLRGRVRN